MSENRELRQARREAQAAEALNKAIGGRYAKEQLDAAKAEVRRLANGVNDDGSKA